MSWKHTWRTFMIQACGGDKSGRMHDSMVIKVEACMTVSYIARQLVAKREKGHCVSLMWMMKKNIFLSLLLIPSLNDGF